MPANEWGDAAVESPQSQANEWGDLPVDQPKPPNVSGVQKMAQDNLAANDNKTVKEGDQKLSPSPMDRLNTAAGLPVDKIISGSAQPSDINADNRVQYTKALGNGSADNSSDWMQTMLRTVAPIAAGLIQSAQHPIDTAEDIGKTAASEVGKAMIHLATSTPGSLASDVIQGTVAPIAAGATRLAGAAYEKAGGELSPEWAERATNPIPEFGQSTLSPFREPLQNTIDYKPQTLFGTATKQAANVVPYLVGGEVSAARKLTGIAAAGVGGVLGEQGATSEKGKQLGNLVGSLPGFMYGASNPLNDSIAKKTNKDSSSITPQDVDQHIAQGSDKIMPSGNDFRVVSQATGIPESGLKIVYNDAGITPEKILTDAQHNPEIAHDVAAGKVPEQYEHMIEQRIYSEDHAEKLHISRNEATSSFSVVDRDGDHVQGGFDSYEEAQQYTEDKKFEAEERAVIENEPVKQPITEKTPAEEQTVIPGAEKISDKELAERKMEEPLREAIAQKAANEGLFDVAGRQQQDLFNGTKTIPPSETGKPTSLRSFLSNNGAKFNEAHELLSIKRGTEKLEGAGALDYAHQIAKEQGYLPQDNPNEPSKGSVELSNLLAEKNGGREAWRDKDTDRVAQAKYNAEAKQWKDPAYVEHEAHNIGLDTERVKGETDKQYTARLLQGLKDFYSDQSGSAPVNLIRKAIGDTIILSEKFAGKLTGNLFERLANSYKAVFQPELFGPLAKRADAYLAKYKAAGQEAENALFRRDAAEIKRVDKLTDDQRREWLYDHETGRWNEEENPDHAAEQAIYDSLRKSEQEKGVGVNNYKQNYLPHLWEKPDAVTAFFRSEAMIKKYGQDWFNKASEFQLVQEGEKAGFKLKTNNYVRMRIARQEASNNMIRTMDLLNDLKESGIATRATDFSVNKRIAKTKQAIADVQNKYKTELEAIKKQASLTDETGKSVVEPISKQMAGVQKRLETLNKRLENFIKEKADIKLTPEQLKALKTGFRIIGPDSKAWNIHTEAGPVWRNAMEAKGLWERQTPGGDSYRNWMAAKAVYVRSKMLASLFHPTHETVIDISSSAASALHHLIQGGKFSDLTARDIPGRLGLTKNTFKLQDHPKIVSWNTAPELRTPEQKADVKRMVEGGLVPSISAEDKIRIRENFDKAIAKIGPNNLRLLGAGIEVAGLPMKPFMEHWIPGMKADSYFQRTDLALKRDPSLANDAGKRGEIFRQIAQDIERNYGEMNRNTQFWNPIVKDIFNATTFSGGWKLAMLQNMRGLAEPAKIAYNFAKTGEFSKEQITHQMLHSYIYTANNLLLGAVLTYILTGAIGTVNDWMNPPTGDKNPDGTPVRLQLPAFFKEPMMLLRDINQDGVVSGTGSFLYHQTLIPSISNTLLGRDFIGRSYITDPTNLQEWKNMGWDSISPIVLSNVQQSEQKGSKKAEFMGWIGFPMAGQWVNQSSFEQKVISKYFEQNPSKDSALEAKLKTEMKGAIISKNSDEKKNIEDKMKAAHMSQSDIDRSEIKHTEKFSEFAWSKLHAKEQARLISSASDDEKKKYRLKTP